jgi:hypothetical protein
VTTSSILRNEYGRFSHGVTWSDRKYKNTKIRVNSICQRYFPKFISMFTWHVTLRLLFSLNHVVPDLLHILTPTAKLIHHIILDGLCGLVVRVPEVRVRFPALPGCLRSSGSGTGSTQPREYN